MSQLCDAFANVGPPPQPQSPAVSRTRSISGMSSTTDAYFAATREALRLVSASLPPLSARTESSPPNAREAPHAHVWPGPHFQSIAVRERSLRLLFFGSFKRCGFSHSLLIVIYLILCYSVSIKLKVFESYFIVRIFIVILLYKTKDQMS